MIAGLKILPDEVYAVRCHGQTKRAPEGMRVAELPDGRHATPVKVKIPWRQVPKNVHDVDVTFLMADGSEIEGTMLSWTCEFIGYGPGTGQTSAAIRDALALSDDVFCCADELKDALALARELCRVRTLANMDSLI